MKMFIEMPAFIWGMAGCARVLGKFYLPEACLLLFLMLLRMNGLLYHWQAAFDGLTTSSQS